MASLKHIEKRKQAQLDRIEFKLDLIIEKLGIVLPKGEQPEAGEVPVDPEALTGDGNSDPKGEQPEAGEAEEAKSRNRKNK